jgi:hypothetical protein
MDGRVGLSLKVGVEELSILSRFGRKEEECSTRSHGWFQVLETSETFPGCYLDGLVKSGHAYTLDQAVICASPRTGVDLYIHSIFISTLVHRISGVSGATKNLMDGLPKKSRKTGIMLGCGFQDDIGIHHHEILRLWFWDKMRTQDTLVGS